MAKTYADYSLYEKIRDAKGLTDYSVAQKAEVATATMTNWKQGVYAPKIDKIIKIASVLDVPIESLLTTTEEQ